jgi:hypothetical protein
VSGVNGRLFILNREGAKDAKVYLFYLLGTDDQVKNYALQAGYTGETKENTGCIGQALLLMQNTKRALLF